MSTFVLVLKAVLVIVPFIIQMVQENKIKTANEKEVLDAFEEEFKARWDKRIKAASDAASAASDSSSSSSGGVSDSEITKDDPNDRHNRK